MKQHKHMEICLTGSQLIIDLLLQLAVQHNLTLTLIAHPVASTSIFCKEFKKRVGRRGCFIESSSEDHAIYEAMGAAYGGAMVILFISSQRVHAVLEGLNHAIWLELPIVIISIQDNPAINTFTFMQVDLKKLAEKDLAFPIITLPEEPLIGEALRLAVDMAFRLMTPLILMVDALALVETYFLSSEMLLSCQLSRDVFSTFYRAWQVPGYGNFKSILGQHYLGFSEEKLKQELSYFRHKTQEITMLKSQSLLESPLSVFNNLIGWGVTSSLVYQKGQPLTQQKKSLYDYLVQLVKEVARETVYSDQQIVLISAQYCQQGFFESDNLHQFITAAGYELSIAFGLNVVRSDLKMVVVLYASTLIKIHSWYLLRELSQQQNLVIFMINDLQLAHMPLLESIKRFCFIYAACSNDRILLKKKLMGAFRSNKAVILEINIPQFFH